MIKFAGVLVLGLAFGAIVGNADLGIADDQPVPTPMPTPDPTPIPTPALGAAFKVQSADGLIIGTLLSANLGTGELYPITAISDQGYIFSVSTMGTLRDMNVVFPNDDCSEPAMTFAYETLPGYVGRVGRGTMMVPLNASPVIFNIRSRRTSVGVCRAPSEGPLRAPLSVLEENVPETTGIPIEGIFKGPLTIVR